MFIPAGLYLIHCLLCYIHKPQPDSQSRTLNFVLRLSASESCFTVVLCFKMKLHRLSGRNSSLIILPTDSFAAPSDPHMLSLARLHTTVRLKVEIFYGVTGRPAQVLKYLMKRSSTAAEAQSECGGPLEKHQRVRESGPFSTWSWSQNDLML